MSATTNGNGQPSSREAVERLLAQLDPFLDTLDGAADPTEAQLAALWIAVSIFQALQSDSDLGPYVMFFNAMNDNPEKAVVLKALLGLRSDSHYMRLIQFILTGGQDGRPALPKDIAAFLVELGNEPTPQGGPARRPATAPQTGRAARSARRANPASAAPPPTVSAPATTPGEPVRTPQGAERAPEEAGGGRGWGRRLMDRVLSDD